MTNLLLTLLEEGFCVHLRRTGLPDIFNEVDVVVGSREELLNGLGGRDYPRLRESNPALLFFAVLLCSKGRSKDRSSGLLGVKP